MRSRHIFSVFIGAASASRCTARLRFIRTHHRKTQPGKKKDYPRVFEYRRDFDRIRERLYMYAFERSASVRRCEYRWNIAAVRGVQSVGLRAGERRARRNGRTKCNNGKSKACGDERARGRGRERER